VIAPHTAALPLPAIAAVETPVMSPYAFTVITGASLELPNVPTFEFTVARSISVRDDAESSLPEKALEKFRAARCVKAVELVSTV